MASKIIQMRTQVMPVGSYGDMPGWQAVNNGYQTRLTVDNSAVVIQQSETGAKFHLTVTCEGGGAGSSAKFHIIRGDGHVVGETTVSGANPIASMDVTADVVAGEQYKVQGSGPYSGNYSIAGGTTSNGALTYLTIT